MKFTHALNTPYNLVVAFDCDKELNQINIKQMRATRNIGNGIGKTLTVTALEAKKARRNAAKKIRKQKAKANSKY